MSRAIVFLLALYGMMVLCESVFASTSSDCEKVKKEIAHLTELSRKGGTTKQMQIWKKFRIDAISRYKYLQCDERGNTDES